MINLSKYSFRNRLIAGFGLILLLNIIALVISFQRLNQVKEDLLMMYDHPFAVTNALKDIKIVILEEQSALADLILDGSVEPWHSYLDIEPEFHKKFKTSFDLIYERYLGDLNDVKRVENTCRAWQIIQNRIIDFIRLGDKAEALHILKTEGTDIVKKIFIEEDLVYKSTLAKGNSLQYKNNNNHFFTILWLLLSVVIMSLFIAFIISRSISKPLKSIVNRLNKNFEHINTKTESSEQEILENAVIQLEESIMKIKASNLELEKANFELEVIQLNMTQQIELLDAAAFVSETDPNGYITYINSKFCKISGYTEEELLGKNHRILKSGLHPRGLFVGMWAAISKGRVWQGEICNKRKDGTYYWMMTTIFPHKNNKGEIEKYSTVRFEITALKELELKLKEHATELNTSNEMLTEAYKELEMFSYSVSHDLKAPLRALQGFSKNLLIRYSSQMDETANRWLNFIQSNAERMDNLITDMLSFSRISRTEVKKSKLNINRMVDDMFNQEKTDYTQPIAFNVGKLPNVWGDLSMIEIVWQNLIGNALKYSSKKEKICIDISGDENETHCHYIIKDNGSGFDMRHYDKLFGIFQRLHNNDEFPGTGVGLANANRIIQKHGGKIWAKSEPEQGAVFEFTLSKI